MIKESFIVASLMALSRTLGLVREILIITLFGASASTDAFFLALKSSTFFREIFAESSFSPVLSKYRTRDFNDYLIFVRQGMFWVALVSIILIVLGFLFTPAWLHVFASGIAQSESESKDLSLLFFKANFLYLGFLMLGAFVNAIFHSARNFLIVSLSTLSFNIVLIATLLMVGIFWELPFKVVAIALPIAGLLQVVFSLSFLKSKTQVTYHFLKPAFHPGLKEIVKLLGPITLIGGIKSLNSIVSLQFASYLPEKTISLITYADRIISFPIAIIGTTALMVTLPTLSIIHAQKDQEAFQKVIRWGIRLTIGLTIPAALGIFVLAYPVTLMLFGYGSLNQDNLLIISQIIQINALSIVFFSLTKLLSSIFLSRQSMKIPLLTMLISLFINALGCFLLIEYFGILGISIASLFATLSNTSILLIFLIYKKTFQPSFKLLGQLSKLLLAACIMAFLLNYFKLPNEFWLSAAWNTRLLNLLPFIIAGIATYSGACLLLGLRPRDFKV